jgi:hypothetical protein
LLESRVDVGVVVEEKQRGIVVGETLRVEIVENVALHPVEG